MAKDSENDQRALDRLAATLVDDILRASDEVIRSEIEGEGATEFAAAARKLFFGALAKQGRARLDSAKAAVVAYQQQANPPI